MAESEDTAGSISKVRRTLKGFFFNTENFTQIEKAGAFVFACTSLITVLFASIVGIAFVFMEERDLYPFLHALERLLGLLTIGVVVAFVGRAKHWSVFFVGLLLVGAILLPVSDVVRYFLIWTGREQSYELLFGQVKSGTDVTGRSSDLAGKIIQTLEEREAIRNARPEDRKRFVRYVVEDIDNDKIITLRELITARGAFPTLELMSEPESRNIAILKFGDERRFVDDVRFLRSEGLIKYPYEDIESIEITTLGEETLRTSAAEAGELEACLVSMEVAHDISESISNGIRVPVGPGRSFYKFRVGGDAPQAEIRVTGLAGADPVFRLDKVARESEQTTRMCELIGEDDDTHGLNPALTVSLQLNSEYLISAWLFHRGPGVVCLSMGDQGSDLPPNCTVVQTVDPAPPEE